MITVYSDKHHLHHGRVELFGGELVSCFEKPERADMILAEVKKRGLSDILEPYELGDEAVLAVHSPAYVAFLQSVWDEWLKTGATGDLLPCMSPARDMRFDRVPKDIYAKACYHSFDTTTAITAGSWAAAKASADVAVTAQTLVASDAQAAFALCRPPGHHASVDYFGGYCFLNNAAIAAQAFRDGGAERVAILDVDYHHGNGTQSIFYRRSDIYTASLHGDPAFNYPCFLGYADEKGEGAGEGYNANHPMAHGTDTATWFSTLEIAMTGVRRFRPDALIVALGVDTYAGDPISHFKLEGDDFLKMGERLAGLGLPTLFVMEGGYAVRDIGINVVNVLDGFEGKLA